MNKNRKYLIIGFIYMITGLISQLSVNAQTSSKLASKSNIILILADDLGYADLGFTGSKDISTPHIDKLARTGIVCSNAYSSHSFCAPTRAGIMTGRYQHRFGFQNNPGPKLPDYGLPVEEIILPKVLSDGGYKSALVGKWHLGVHPHQHPIKKGFDEFFGFTGGGHDYFTCNPESKSDHAYKALLERDGKRETLKKYLTEELTDYGVDFIERNKEIPFFLFMSYNAPHTPLQASEKYLKRMSHIKNEDRRTYAAMISALDDGVGQIIDKLEELGLDENTLVLFMSDNGGAPYDTPSNKPFNGSKGTVLEGGIHVPFIANWKGKLQAGTYDKLVMSFDLFATATALAGVENPSDRKIDSRNLLPYLLGDKKSSPHEYLYWTQGDYQEAARTGDYKFIQIDGEEKYLYDLKNDIGETTDVSLETRRQLKKMDKHFKSWKKELPQSEHKNSGIANEMQRNYIESIKGTRK